MPARTWILRPRPMPGLIRLSPHDPAPVADLPPATRAWRRRAALLLDAAEDPARTGAHGAMAGVPAPRPAPPIAEAALWAEIAAPRR